MTPEEQDNLIDVLAALAHDGAPRATLDELAAEMARGYSIEVGSAARGYKLYLERTAPGRPLPPDFARRQYAAHQRFLVSTALAAARQPLTLPEHELSLERRLYLGWHFPEHPLWMAHARAGDWLIVAARRSPWVEAVVGPERLYAFRQNDLGLEVARALRRGRPLFAMFDFCYEDSLSVVSPFLGGPARTPAGLLRLAAQFGYTARVISGDERSAGILDTFELSEGDVQSHADRANRAIEGAILMDPARWLLWSAWEYRRYDLPGERGPSASA